VLDGQDEDESLCLKYDDSEELFQSIDLELLVYDVDDEDGSRVLALNYDMDSTPHPIYCIYDDVGMIDGRISGGGAYIYP
jgi:hypothetical protein